MVSWIACLVVACHDSARPCPLKCNLKGPKVDLAKGLLADDDIDSTSISFGVVTYLYQYLYK